MNCVARFLPSLFRKFVSGLVSARFFLRPLHAFQVTVTTYTYTGSEFSLQIQIAQEVQKQGAVAYCLNFVDSAFSKVFLLITFSGICLDFGVPLISSALSQNIYSGAPHVWCRVAADAIFFLQVLRGIRAGELPI